MSVTKISLYAIGLLMLICQVGVAQGKSPVAKSTATDLKPVDLEDAESGQVMDDEIIADSSATAEGEAGTAGAPRKCVPVEKKEGEEGEGSEDGEEAAEGEEGEEGAEGEVECVPVYEPVEPPPVISDEITFTNPTNPGSEETKKLKEEYDAVVAALGESQEVAYRNYQFDVHDRSVTFAQYQYENFSKSRRAGILLIGIGAPVFGGLTALGSVFLAQAISDECLKNSDGGCDVTQQRDAEELKQKGLFLVIFGATATVATVVAGAVIIKRNNGPMKALEPLLASEKSSKKAAKLIGIAPLVATEQAIAPGASLAVSF